MSIYRVVYEIDVDADSPAEAAREAYSCMIDSESATPVLDVIPWIDEDTPPFGVSVDVSNCTSIDLGA